MPGACRASSSPRCFVRGPGGDVQFGSSNLCDPPPHFFSRWAWIELSTDSGTRGPGGYLETTVGAHQPGSWRWRRCKSNPAAIVIVVPLNLEVRKRWCDATELRHGRCCSADVDCLLFKCVPERVLFVFSYTRRVSFFFYSVLLCGLICREYPTDACSVNCID